MNNDWPTAALLIVLVLAIAHACHENRVMQHDTDCVPAVEAP